jgi:hypothetical protein
MLAWPGQPNLASHGDRSGTPGTHRRGCCCTHVTQSVAAAMTKFMIAVATLKAVIPIS